MPPKAKKGAASVPATATKATAETPVDAEASPAVVQPMVSPPVASTSTLTRVIDCTRGARRYTGNRYTRTAGTGYGLRAKRCGAKMSAHREWQLQ